MDHRSLSNTTDCSRAGCRVVQLAVWIADDRFSVDVHAAAGAPRFGLEFALPMADTIAHAEKGEKHEEQKRDCDQECIPVGKERLCRQKRPPDGETPGDMQLERRLRRLDGFSISY